MKWIYARVAMVVVVLGTGCVESRAVLGIEGPAPGAVIDVHVLGDVERITPPAAVRVPYTEPIVFEIWLDQDLHVSPVFVVTHGLPSVNDLSLDAHIVFRIGEVWLGYNVEQITEDPAW